MSGETGSGWTTDTIKQHLEHELQNHKDLHTALGAASLMIWEDHRREHEAEHISVKERLDAVNEFRGQLSDQQETFASRGEVNQQFKSLEQKTDEFKKDFERYRDIMAAEIRSLRESRSEVAGTRIAIHDRLDNSKLNIAIIGLGLSSLFSLVALVIGIINLITRLNGH